MTTSFGFQLVRPEPRETTVPQPIVPLEPVVRGHRGRAIGSIAGVMAVLALIVVGGLTGKPGATPEAPAPTSTSTLGSPSEAGVSPSASIVPSPLDLSFTLPGGDVVVDETHLPSLGGPPRSVSTVVAHLAETSHYAIVGRCYGPGAVAWEIGSDQAGDAESGEVPCDGKTHGTGIVTFSGTELPLRLIYDTAISFRFVVTLIQG